MSIRARSREDRVTKNIQSRLRITATGSDSDTGLSSYRTFAYCDYNRQRIYSVSPNVKSTYS